MVRRDVCPLVVLGERRFCSITDRVESDRSPDLDPSLWTQTDRFGQFGLSHGEVQVLATWLGDEHRMAEVLWWVVRAHQRLELLAFPSWTGMPSVAMLRDVHPGVVAELERLLCSLVGDPTASTELVRSILARRIPGRVFPRASSKHELEELLAAARTINRWLAERAGFLCGCS